jgi:hypothetical protein
MTHLERWKRFVAGDAQQEPGGGPWYDAATGTYYVPDFDYFGDRSASIGGPEQSSEDDASAGHDPIAG